jgi:uncharacterized protein YbbK (DUF523 family)
MILVSACLAGINCKYDGGNNVLKDIQKLIQEKKAILICPEQMGGMATPRLPCEIINGDGREVLKGKAKVINLKGEDQSPFFIKGAEETLKIAKLYGANTALLKARSPSCGSGTIYDGRFQSSKKKGDGVTAALLKENGIEVFTEEEL